jgi:hypothetical protein
MRSPAITARCPVFVASICSGGPKEKESSHISGIRSTEDSPEIGSLHESGLGKQSINYMKSEVTRQQMLSLRISRELTKILTRDLGNKIIPENENLQGFFFCKDRKEMFSNFHITLEITSCHLPTEVAHVLHASISLPRVGNQSNMLHAQPPAPSKSEQYSFGPRS